MQYYIPDLLINKAGRSDNETIVQLPEVDNDLAFVQFFYFQRIQNRKGRWEKQHRNRGERPVIQVLEDTVVQNYMNSVGRVFNCIIFQTFKFKRQGR